VRLPLTLTCCGDSTNARPWPRAWISANHVLDGQTNAVMCGFGIHRNVRPGRAAWPGRAAHAAYNTRQRASAGGTCGRARTWEGPLVSETIDLYSGSTGEPEESPSLSRSASESAGVAGSAGASPAQAGAVRSWPDADDGTGTTTVRSGARKSGSGLSAMVLPELQRLAQSLGLTGTARMRKGDLIAAIEQAQRGGAGASSGSSGPGRAADSGRDGAGASGGRGGRARAAAGGGTAAVSVSGTAESAPDLHSDTSGNS